MRQVVSLTSTYSSDEFGICSALFELGGLVVMHDASGCNSTYTTHDEPRWYDTDSMIYVSAISEVEAIMGDDEKLLRALEETAKALQPKFIAIVGAPIPYMIGTDLPAIARLIEERTGIPAFGFPANGMNLYTRGISDALFALVDRFCPPPENPANVSETRRTVRLNGEGSDDFRIFTTDVSETRQAVPPKVSDASSEDTVSSANDNVFDRLACNPKAASGGSISDLSDPSAEKINAVTGYFRNTGNPPSPPAGRKMSLTEPSRRMNILGATPLDLPAKGCISAIWAWAGRFGFEKGASLSLETSLEEITRAGEASVNLVVSYGGLAAARLLRKRFGTPYVVGIPFGTRFSELLGRQLREIFFGSISTLESAKPVKEILRSAQNDRRFDSEGVSSYYNTAVLRVSGDEPLFIVGESVFAASFAAAVELEQGIPTKVLCPVDTEDWLLRPGDLRVESEDDLILHLSNARKIAADPLFRPLAPKAANFYDLPHTAFSGRIFEKTVPNRIAVPVREDFRKTPGSSFFGE